MKHGLLPKHNRCYFVWYAMLRRCTNKSHPAWASYGGRGIKVCERWQEFGNFFADMGDPPKGASLDRIDNDGNYEPANCRWATQRQQAQNRRNSAILEYDGERLALTEWARRLGIADEVLRSRIKRGWPLSEALTLTALPRRYCRNRHSRPNQ